MALDLAVASDGPTRRRLRRHLPSFDIDVHGLSVSDDIRTITDETPEPWRRFDVGFVYPARIVEGDVVTALTGLPWVTDRADILTTRNKAGTLAQLAAAGLPTPETVHVSSPADADAVRDAFEAIDGPVVVKPNATTKGTAQVLVTDLDSLHGVADLFDLIHAFPATGDRSYLLQAYVPDARDLRLTTIDGHVAAAVERRFPDDGADRWVRNVHRGATAVPVDPPAEAVDVAERAAAELDIAVLGIDVLVTTEGPMLLEVNGRPTIDRVEKYPPDFYDRLAAVIRRAAGRD